MYKQKEKLKTYSYRQFPSVKKKIDLVCKKYKITPSEFTRISENTELERVDINYKP